MIRIFAVLAACFAMACSSGEEKLAGKALGADTTGKTIRVTGIPDENPTALAREYQPMVDMLEASLGTTVEYVPVTDYGAAVQALAAGQVDFAWLGGFTHVQSRIMADVVPLVMRDIDREFRSVFIASTNSGITEVAGIKGHTLAFGSKSSTSGHLMPRYFLKETYDLDVGVDLSGAPVYSGAHDATVKMVESGKVDAGALNMQVWQRMIREGAVDTSRVREIWKTPPYVDYVWTARRAVAEDIRTKFSNAFLNLDAGIPTHKSVLDRMGAEKYVTAQSSDFDAIERMAREIGLIK